MVTNIVCCDGPKAGKPLNYRFPLPVQKDYLADLMDHLGHYLYRTRVLIFDSSKPPLNLLWQATQLFHALLARS